MDCRGGNWKLFGSFLCDHRLLTTFFIGFFGLISSSFLMFLVEKDNVGGERQFASFGDALWWGVVTICTVGYGDKVPQTWQGKVIASFLAIFGVLFFSLPTSMLASRFALKVQV